MASFTPHLPRPSSSMSLIRLCRTLWGLDVCYIVLSQLSQRSRLHRVAGVPLPLVYEDGPPGSLGECSG